MKVYPGGATFSTITAALNSITDNGPDKEYVVKIGNGTYNEVVVCKPYVYLTGFGAGKTIITAPAPYTQGAMGTLQGCSNAIVLAVTIISTSSGFGSFVTAVSCNAAEDLYLEQCMLQAVDDSGQANICAVSLDLQGNGSSVTLREVEIITTCGSGQPHPIGVGTFSSSFVFGDQCILSTAGGTTPRGGLADGGSMLVLNASLVSADGYSLIGDPTTDAWCYARNCKLEGPVGPNVKIITD